MAFRIGRDLDDPAEIHDINVTPFIDVMLVLLIVFMIAAPLATTDLRIDLPASTAVPQPRPDKPVFLTLKADRSLALDDTPLQQDALAAGLDRATGGDKQARIFLRADKSVDYGALMTVMDGLAAAGYLKVGLVTLEQPGKP